MELTPLLLFALRKSQAANAAAAVGASVTSVEVEKSLHGSLFLCTLHTSVYLIFSVSPADDRAGGLRSKLKSKSRSLD